MIAIANYSILGVLNISYNSLISLFLAMPIELGGLGLDPLRMVVYHECQPRLCRGFPGPLCQQIGSSVRREAPIRLFHVRLSALMAFVPGNKLVGKTLWFDVGVWVGIVMMGVSFAISDMAYSYYTFLFTCHLDRRLFKRLYRHDHHCSGAQQQSLGATNGLSQAVVCIGRIFAPGMATSMFSFSVEHNLMGGYMVYSFLFSLSSFAIVLARRLIHKPEDSVEELSSGSKSNAVLLEAPGGFLSMRTQAGPPC